MENGGIRMFVPMEVVLLLLLVINRIWHVAKMPQQKTASLTKSTFITFGTTLRVTMQQWSTPMPMV